MSTDVTTPKHTPFYGFEFVGMPSTRKVAIAAGAKHYFTGKPCKRGHVVARHLDRTCTECHTEQSRVFQKSPKRREYFRKYCLAYDRMAKRQEYNRAWGRTPKARVYARESVQRREASKRNATPPWLTPEHIVQMRAVYAEAAHLSATTGIPRHVDHIIPLTHPDVQGYHCPWNLQILTAEDNLRKSNAFDGTMENETWRRLT